MKREREAKQQVMKKKSKTTNTSAEFNCIPVEQPKSKPDENKDPSDDGDTSDSEYYSESDSNSSDGSDSSIIEVDSSDGDDDFACTNGNDDCIVDTGRFCGYCGGDLCEICYEDGLETQVGATEADEVLCQDCLKKTAFYHVRGTGSDFDGMRFMISRESIEPEEFKDPQRLGDFQYVLECGKKHDHLLILSLGGCGPLFRWFDEQTGAGQHGFLMGSVKQLDGGNSLFEKYRKNGEFDVTRKISHKF